MEGLGLLSTILLIVLVAIFEVRYTRAAKKGLDAAHELRRQSIYMAQSFTAPAKRRHQRHVS